VLILKPLQPWKGKEAFEPFTRPFHGGDLDIARSRRTVYNAAMDLTPLGKLLISVGLIVAGVGVLFFFGGKIHWFGRLPGDILVKGKNFTFYFPLMTCLVISIVVSLLLFLFRGR